MTKRLLDTRTTYHGEPVWHPGRHLRRGFVPPARRAWLFDRESLTLRLQQACGGRFRVHVLHQGWARPSRSEARALGMEPGRFGLVRQVYLMCGDTPWVYARTVIPPATLTGRHRRLAHLKTRSLGATLFSDPGMRRGEVEVAHLTPREHLYAIACQGLGRCDDDIWARRSVFRLSGKPLIVSEFFLPAMGKHPCRG